MVTVRSAFYKGLMPPLWILYALRITVAVNHNRIVPLRCLDKNADKKNTSTEGK